jgi:hypothetical protein
VALTTIFVMITATPAGQTTIAAKTGQGMTAGIPLPSDGFRSQILIPSTTVAGYGEGGYLELLQLAKPLKLFD